METLILDELWPEARAIADPERVLYEAFGLTEGTLGQLLGPRVLVAAARAALRGNGVGKRQGDVRTMPGCFLVRDGAVVWEHPYRHAGDLPPFGRTGAIVRDLG